ncbi:MAG: cysteine desulfurase [Saprospiraceae bacterium]|nr:cysteine desulfurase [Saprospiraceae bacterium]
MKSTRIYLDYAATTPLHPEVGALMHEVSMTIGGNPSSIHAEGRLARTVIEESRKTICKTLQASLSEVFFTSCGTESNNTILIGAVRDLGVRKIISSPLEHHCILHALDYLSKQYPVEVVSLPVDAFGQPELEALQEELARSEGTKTLVSLMQVNNEIGTTIDLRTYGQVCHDHGALFHSDTVQAIGFASYDLQSMPVDFLSGSAHKFYGPKGVGFMYIRNDYVIQPLLYGGSQERNMRSGTENIAGIAGMAKAMELAYSDLVRRNDHMREMRTRLLEGLKLHIPGLTVNGAHPECFSPKILSVNIPAGPRTELLLMNLDIAGVSASGGSACSSGVESASHVLSHLPIREGDKTVRFSFSTQTTGEEIDRVIQIMASLTHVTSPSSSTYTE